MRDALNLFREAAKEFSDDNVPRLGAALAYYTLFSVAPLLLVVIAIAGIVFGREAARGEIFAQMRGLIGASGAEAVQSLVASAAKPKTGVIAMVIGVATLLLGASGVFGELKGALNTIWEIPPRPSGGIFGMIRERFLSMAMVLGVGFLLLVSLVLDTAVAAFAKFAGRRLPGGEALWHTIELALSFAVITVLFAMIFRFLPDTRIAWRDVWFGAAFTALLFVVGKFVLALYLGKKSVSSSYGAAGSLIVLLLWVYYSAQILFFGAEVTQVYARRHGSLLGRPPRARDEREARGGRETRALPPRPALAPAQAKSGRSSGAGKVVAGGVLGLLVGGFLGAASAVLVGVKAVKGVVRLPRRRRVA